VTVLVAAVLLSVAAPQAPIGEDQAIDLVARAMPRLGWGQKLSCLSYMVEERSIRSFDIAVREKHDKRCGGDPNVMPVVERFRVARSRVKLWRYDVVGDRYLPCQLNRALQPVCR
jgi:hypothetical protein